MLHTEKGRAIFFMLYRILFVLSSIWEYLIDLSKTKKTTIIITTHYIDETRQAHMVSIGYAVSHLAD
jgi:hypothetical protein